MTSVTQKTVQDPAAQFEDGMSVQGSPEEPAPALASDLAASDEARDADSFSLMDTVKSFFGMETPTPKKAAESLYGPDKLPSPPEPPRRMVAPGSDLAGAKIVAKADWAQYAREYGQYLKDFEGVFAHCESLEELRRCQPEPPDDALARSGLWDDKAQQMKDDYAAMFKTKVDRGYELLDETPPGTIIAVLKGSAAIKAGPVAVGGEFSLEANTTGRTNADINFGPDLAGVGATGSLAGTKEVSVVVGSYGAKANSRGDAEIKLGHGAGVAFNPYEKKLGVTLGFSKEFEGPGKTKAKAGIEADLLLKAMPEKDVRRALEGWLRAPPGEDVNERWLREQQLKARCLR